MAALTLKEGKGLVRTGKLGDIIMIGDEIQIEILDIRGPTEIRYAVKAPRRYAIKPKKKG